VVEVSAIFFKLSLVSYKKIFFAELNLGNFFEISKSIFIRLPSPGPSSTILIFSGLPNFSHVEIIQIDISSEKILEIVGAVIKSPFLPNGT
jgi:hypothetical protein